MSLTPFFIVLFFLFVDICLTKLIFDCLTFKEILKNNLQDIGIPRQNTSISI